MIIKKLYNKIFKPKKSQTQIDFISDCNKFIEKFLHRRFLLDGRDYELSYGETLDGIPYVRILLKGEEMGHFYTKSLINAIAIAVIMNKMLGHEST